jgi:hypothetical protein
MISNIQQKQWSVTSELKLSNTLKLSSWLLAYSFLNHLLGKPAAMLRVSLHLLRYWGFWPTASENLDLLVTTVKNEHGSRSPHLVLYPDNCSLGEILMATSKESKLQLSSFLKSWPLKTEIINVCCFKLLSFRDNLCIYQSLTNTTESFIFSSSYAAFDSLSSFSLWILLEV